MVNLVSSQNTDNSAAVIVDTQQFDPNTIISTLNTEVGNLNAALNQIVTIDMGAADYTMTVAEAKAYAKALRNVGDGTKTLTWPSSADGVISIPQFVANFGLNKVRLSCQSGGATGPLHSGDFTELEVVPGAAIFNMADQYALNANRQYNGVLTKTNNFDVTTSEAGVLLQMNNAGAKAFNFDKANTDIMPVFSQGWIRDKGAGALTITGSGGVTIEGITTLAQNDLVRWFRDGDTIIVG